MQAGLINTEDIVEIHIETCYTRNFLNIYTFIEVISMKLQINVVESASTVYHMQPKKKNASSRSGLYSASHWS